MPHRAENLSDHDLLVDSATADELRAQRVWRYVFVIWSTWIMFTVLYFFRGYQIAASICGIETVMHLVCLTLLRRSKKYGAVLNVFLSFSLLGLVSISLSHTALANTIWFVPISIVAAYQLLGVRTASVWLVVTLASFVTYFVLGCGFESSFRLYFDQLFLMLAVPSCLFFCCQQGEQYYQQRTKDLFRLSQNLQEKSKHLERLATTDELTGLSNRFQFKVDLREAIDRSEKTSKPVALFVIDMDGFKEVNDTMGHAVGDAVLVEISKRLKKRFADDACVSRLGGDEFCLLIDVRDVEHAEKLAAEVNEILTVRYELAGDEFLLGVSTGYALSPDHTRSEEELFAYADTAMFVAKERGTGHACYDTEMTDRLIEHRTMQEKLANALERDEFFLVYQPQVNLDTGRVIGVEALLRWRYDGEVIPPYRFISMLEESREIIPVSNWVIREACRQLAVWHAAGHDVEMSVNVSAVQFDDPTFTCSVAESIAEFDLDATKLDLEITEGLLIDDVPSAIEKLNSVKAMGVSISVDDFGTGYSSLAYLRQFPIDRLKIDRTFIMDIPGDDDGVIAMSIIVLAKSLGLKVLAEGVETVGHLAFLESHNCDEYQGFYFSKPVLPEEAEQLFDSPAVSSPQDSTNAMATV